MTCLGRTDFTLQSLDNGDKLAIFGALVVPYFSDENILPHRVDVATIKHFEGVEIPVITNRKQVDILIGQSDKALLTVLEEHVGAPDEPNLVFTRLGPAASGGRVHSSLNSLRALRVQTIPAESNCVSWDKLQQSCIGSNITLPHIPKLSESIKFVLKSHGIKTVFKPPQKIGNLLSSHKDMVDAEHRQGAVYKIKCEDCNQCYIRETKRWFVTRKKEHMRDVRLMKRDSTALSKHAIQSEHEIDWENFEILDLENDYVKRKFIESYFINSQNNCLNDRNSVAFPHVYQNLFAPIVRSSSA